ncbi:hypothetical protein P7C70_g5743, partial [Phenoliferia sp. Uapishka_3]
MGGLVSRRKRSGSSNSSSTSSSSPPPEQTTPFRLLDLPPEIWLEICRHLTTPIPTDSFPAGPSDSVLAFSQTCTLFNGLLRPSIWNSITYFPLRRDSVRSKDYRKKRSLSALKQILDEAESSTLGPLPIELLQVSHPEGARGEDEEEVEAEQYAFVEIVQRLTGEDGGLKVLWLKSVFLSSTGPAKELGDRLILAIAGSKSLKAVRFNQVEAGSAKLYSGLGRMEGMKTLQVLHGQRSLLEFARICPNLESLLMWPERRRFGSLVPIICSLLGSLRYLSLDAVSEPDCFVQLTAELQRRQSLALPTPLTELFLEGHQASGDRSALISALSHTDLKRLALYHLHAFKPNLIHDIAVAVPNLEGLTLVLGDTSTAFSWPSPLEAYIDQLTKLKHLKFYASDRQSPNPQRLDQMQVEYDSLSKVGKAVDSLETAVAILLDVSQGAFLLSFSLFVIL